MGLLVLSIISQLRSKSFNNSLTLNILINLFFISFRFQTIFNDNLNFEEKIVNSATLSCALERFKYRQDGFVS